MSRVPNCVALVLVLLAVPEIPWIFFSPATIAVQSGYDDSFASTIWVHNIIDVAGFLGAAALAVFRVRFWPVAALLICGYVAIIATPPFLRMGVRGGFIDNLEATWRHALNSGLTDGFYTVWNLVVLPVVPALMIAIIPVLWWMSRSSSHAAESNL